MIHLLTALVFTMGAPSSPVLAPTFLKQDIPVIVERLDLSDGESSVLADVLTTYLESEAQARAQTEASLALLDPDQLHVDWVPEDYSDMQKYWSEAMQEVDRARDQQEAREIQEAQSRWAASWLNDHLAQRDLPTASARTELLRAYAQMRASQRESLDRDLDLIFTPEQSLVWRQVEQAAARQRSPFRPVIDGEGTNLRLVVDETFSDDPELRASLRAALADYEMDWAQAAMTRDEILRAQWPLAQDARERGDDLTLLQLAREEVKARQALVEVNLRWYDLLASRLPSREKNRFQRAVNESMYPQIFLTSQPERMLNYWLSDATIDPDLRDRIIATRAVFGAPRLKAAAKERAGERASSGRRITARAEQKAMAKIFGPSASFRLQWGPEDEALEMVGSMAHRRREIDMAWAQALHQLVGPARWDAVPMVYRLSPPQVRDRIKDETGAPLRLTPLIMEKSP